MKRSNRTHLQAPTEILGKVQRDVEDEQRNQHRHCHRALPQQTFRTSDVVRETQASAAPKILLTKASATLCATRRGAECSAMRAERTQ